MTGYPLHKAKTKRPSPRHALRLGGFLRVFTSQPIRMRAPRSNINDIMNASAPQIPRMLNNNQYLIIEILVQSIQRYKSSIYINDYSPP